MCTLHVYVFLRERLTQCFETRGFLAAAIDLLHLSLSLGNIRAPKWYFSGDIRLALFTRSSK